MRPQKTLADYVAIAICPALIMALVGSLMYFLLEVFYAGPHDDRMRWVVFFFVMGVVLIARISMMGEIAARAAAYGLVLAIAAGFVVNQFIKYPEHHPLAAFGWLINLGIMALVWWSAHRLTWDCTLIDDEADASGQGLLQAAGLEQEAQESASAVARSHQPGDAKPTRAIDPKPGWWQGWVGGKRKSGHTPGVWIVYYSLAALPLFGLGQIMIPASEPARRRFAFWMLAIYVAAGLGLLLATSFLGLRRYLRQRKLQMPAAMTGIWLLVGGAFVAALLALGALLPRPNPEYVNLMSAIEGPQGKASRHDVLGGKAGKKEGRQAGSSQSDKPGGNRPAQTKSGQGKDGKGGEGKGGQDGKQGDPSSKQGDGKQGSGSKNSGRDASGKQDQSNQQGGNQSKDGQGKSNDKSGRDSRDKQGERNPDSKEGDQNHEGHDKPGEKGEKRPDRNAERKDQDQEKKKEEEQESGSSEDQQSQRDQNQVEPPEPPSALASILKWIVYGILALVGIYVLIRYWREILAMLASMLAALREFWARLLGWRRKQAAGKAAEGEEEEVIKTPPPFATFRNPFLDGTADTYPVNRVTRYSFEALESWAYEYGLGREAGETPLEFAARLADDVPALSPHAQRLAEYYSRVVYARSSLNRPALDPLRLLWQKLTPRARQPVAAN